MIDTVSKFSLICLVLCSSNQPTKTPIIKMKTVIALAALLAVAVALPQQRNIKVYKNPPTASHYQTAQVYKKQPVVYQTAPVYKSQPAVVHQTVPVYKSQAAVDHNQIVLVKETPSNNIGLDGYQFAYELSNGQSHEESAQVEVRGPEEGVNRVRGKFSFVGEDGVTYTVTYVADENGFQPQGAHLPVAPVA